MSDNHKPVPQSVLVFGPESRTAAPLVAHLRRHAPSVRLRLSTSNPAKIDRLRAQFPDAEVVSARFDDLDSLRVAVKDIEGAFIMTPDPTDEAAAMGNIIAAFQEAGSAKHIIRLLALQPEANNHRLPAALRNMSFMPTEHPIAKRLLDESGLPVTYLNSGATYMDNILRMAPGLRAERTLFWPERLIPFVDPRDIGEAAARLLLSDDHRHIGQFHTMNNGVDILRFSEVARMMSEVWGEPIRHDSSKDSFFKWYADRGQPYLDLLWEFFLYEEDNNVVWARNDFLARTLGREPMTVRRWLAEHREAVLGEEAAR